MMPDATETGKENRDWYPNLDNRRGLGQIKG